MLEIINKQIEKYFVKQKLYAIHINRSVNNLPNFKNSLIKRIERVNKDIRCIGMRAVMYRDDYYPVIFKGVEMLVDYDHDNEQLSRVFIRGVDITELVNDDLEKIGELVSMLL